MGQRRLGRSGLMALNGRFWGASRANRVAVLAGVLWAVLVASYAVGYFGDAAAGQARGTPFLDAVFFLLALVLPLGLIGLAAWLAAELARQREAVAALVTAAGPLAEALAETRRALAEEGPLTPGGLDRALRDALAPVAAEVSRGVGQALEGRMAELGEGQRRLEALLASVSARAAGAPRTRPPALRPAKASAEALDEPELPSLPVEPEEELGWEDFLRALDFPRDPDDREGFRALRRALRHHSLAQMLQAAEDVLNLLSQEGVYMDDLEHAPAPPAAWRAFAEGSRGPEFEAVGGIRDEAALAVVRRLMKADGVFRDTALFFQRRFDGMLGEVAPKMEDEALVALADTRSGRAFMLCARASGSFG